jgi:uncharacterized protein (TIGR00645 family)
MPQPRPSLPPFLVRVGNALELIIERCLFGARWLLAPFYVGLALALVVLMVKFVEEFWHLAIHGVAWSEAQVILGLLTLIDLALTGSLLVIVIFSGYENFVSKIDHSTHEDWPSWMGTIDFAALKLKLLSSIVAISAIHLLKQFMEIKTLYKSTEVSIADRQLFWYVVIHLIFVFSSVLLALSDRIAGSHGDHGPTPHQPPSPQPQQQPRSTAEHATGTTAPVTRAHDA